MSHYSFTHEVAVPPEVVWDVLSDHRGMSRWTAARRVVLEVEGDPPPNGVGAVRAIHAVGPPIRERVTAFEQPRRLAYTMVSGAPMSDYFGETVLEPTATGTRFTWTIDFRPRIPGVQFVAAAVIRRVAAGLAAESQRRGVH
jgi:uncharacterized protein YndB with AHSA1/START domain